MSEERNTNLYLYAIICDSTPHDAVYNHEE